MMGQPRNPRYFPKMKVRGARRQRLAPFQRLAGVFDEMTLATKRSAESFRQFVTLLKEKTND
jgi:hypothetical protein